jgi:hypothetical protein
MYSFRVPAALTDWWGSGQSTDFCRNESHATVDKGKIFLKKRPIFLGQLIAKYSVHLPSLDICINILILFFSSKYRHQVSNADIKIHKGNKIQKISDALLVRTHGAG